MFLLATGSEARKKLLIKLGFKFKTKKSNAKEKTFSDPEKTVLINSINKAMSVYNEKINVPVVGCDTIVYFGRKIIGKPKTKKQAKEILKKLSGKKHKVYSGIAVFNGEKLVLGFTVSIVKLRKMSAKEILEQIKGKKVLNRAGAYAIQEKNNPIESYKGSFETILGIDSSLLNELLGKVL